jgi:hypothetical protein
VDGFANNVGRWVLLLYWTTRETAGRTIIGLLERRGKSVVMLTVESLAWRPDLDTGAYGVEERREQRRGEVAVEGTRRGGC